MQMFQNLSDRHGCLFGQIRAQVLHQSRQIGQTLTNAVEGLEPEQCLGIRWFCENAIRKGLLNGLAKLQQVRKLVGKMRGEFIKPNTVMVMRFG